MRFKLKAVKANGKHYEEIKESSDKLSIYQELKQKGDTVVSIIEDLPKKSIGLKFRLESFLGRISTNDKIIFARNLGFMIEAGLPMTRSLSVLERQVRNPKLKSILSKIQSDINGGESLSESLGKSPEIFSSLFISMVKAGEESGSLSQSLKSVADQMEKTHLLVKRLRGAMIYPSIVITAMAIVGILLLIYLVPTLTQTFEEMKLELPLSTRIIIAMSSFLKDNVILSFSGLILFVMMIYSVLKTKQGKRFLDILALKVPIISSMVKGSNSAKTARTLSSLLSAGVDFLVAINITESVIQNSFYKSILRRAGESVEKGGTISSIFVSDEAEKLYPPFVGEMASIGEETGKLSLMFSNVADFYEEEVNQKTKNFSTIIEPVLMIFIGIFVAIFAVSMLGPIYSLVDAL